MAEVTAAPTGTVKAVLAWVGADVDRARVALATELTGRARKGIVAPLEQLLADSIEQTPTAQRAELGRGLMTDAVRLRGQMFAPVTERRAMVVSDGAELGSHVEMVDIDRDEPTFAEKKIIAQTIQIVVAQAEQLLADEATAGGGVLHDLDAERAARRSAAAAAAPGSS